MRGGMEPCAPAPLQRSPPRDSSRLLRGYSSGGGGIRSGPASMSGGTNRSSSREYTVPGISEGTGSALPGSCASCRPVSVPGPAASGCGRGTGADASTGQGDTHSCAGAAASTAGGGLVSCGGSTGDETGSERNIAGNIGLEGRRLLRGSILDAGRDRGFLGEPNDDASAALSATDPGPLLPLEQRHIQAKMGPAIPTRDVH